MPHQRHSAAKILKNKNRVYNKKDIGLGKTFKNLTPITISKNEIQLSEFVIPRTCTELLDNRRYFLAIYKINCQCLGSRMAYSSVDYSGV